MTTAAAVARLRQNGQRYHDRAIEYSEFDRLQKATWAAIHARGERFVEKVHRLLRQD